MSAPPTISIVIVNWNTADLLLACLASIRQGVQLPHEILVVDNASEDGSVERASAAFPEVRILAQSSNLGFARANNVALVEAAGRLVLLLNPDTELRPGALEALVTHLDTHPRAGIAGPPLWNPDGSAQPSVQTFPTLASEFLRQTMLYRIVPGRMAREAQRRDSRPVDVVSGAALCIRRECLEVIGLLDQDIFMFYEDTDWCRRAKDAGWEIWFVDGPGVVHHKGAASGGPARTRTLLDSHRGMLRYFRKHHGPGVVPALRVIAFLGATLRSARSLLLLTLGRNPPDQRARLAAYRGLLRWALLGGEPGTGSAETRA